MRILVTGGTGIVGTKAVDELLRRGHSVRLLSRHATQNAERWPVNVEPFDGDIGSAASIAGAADGCDAVLHIAGIAAEQPPDVTFQRVNVDGTRNVVSEAGRAGVPRLVFVSSLGADRGVSAYHQSKRRAEEIVRQFDGDWLILRPGNVYGPGDEVISLLLRLVRSSRVIPVIGLGGQRFQPIWHEDLARALATAVERRADFGRTIAVAGDEVTTMRDLVDRLGRTTGRNVVLAPMPPAVASLGAALAEAAGIDLDIDDNKLTMLAEENFIEDPVRNALHELAGPATPLDEGLRKLAVSLPEQLLSDGVGPLRRKRYLARIEGSGVNAERLLTRICNTIGDVVPLDFRAEPGAPAALREGAVLTGEISGRGHFAMRVEERTLDRVILATMAGHPLAGVLVLEAFDVAPDSIDVAVTTYTRAADILDSIAMTLFGEAQQEANWRRFLENVIAISEGCAPGGVRTEVETLEGRDAARIEEWIDRVIARRNRRERSDGERGTTAAEPPHQH